MQRHDGLLDISRASSGVTVSWNRLQHHDKTSLVGGSNAHLDDLGRPKVTIHHNLWEQTRECSPRVRYGQVQLANRLHRVDAAGRHRQWAVAERIGCIARHARGGLLAAMKTGLFQLWPGDHGSMASALVQAIDFPQPAMRFNDGRTDRQGRFWVTSMVRELGANKAAGALLRCDARGLQASGITGLFTGNGLGFSPPRSQDGRLDRSLAVPAAKPAMCAFGGPALDRLYVTSIAPAVPAPGYDPALAGAVFVLQPGCNGLADPPFAG